MARPTKRTFSTTFVRVRTCFHARRTMSAFAIDVPDLRINFKVRRRFAATSPRAASRQTEFAADFIDRLEGGRRDSSRRRATHGRSLTVAVRADRRDQSVPGRAPGVDHADLSIQLRKSSQTARQPLTRSVLITCVT